MYENVVKNVLYLGYKMLLLFFILNGFVGFKKTKPRHHSCMSKKFKKPDLLGLWKNPLTIPCLAARPYSTFPCYLFFSLYKVVSQCIYLVNLGLGKIFSYVSEEQYITQLLAGVRKMSE